MGVLLHLVTLVGLVKSLFLAVRSLFGYTPIGCFASLGCFASHFFGEAGHLCSKFGVGGANFLLLVVRDAIAIVSCSNTDVLLVAAAARLSK